MKKGEMLGTMLVIATNAHAGQFDRGGAPYILHPLKVMHYLKSDDEELMCMALGHDVIEDTAVTYQDLRDAGISERVIAGIRALTKQPGQTYDEYKTLPEWPSTTCSTWKSNHDWLTINRQHAIIYA